MAYGSAYRAIVDRPGKVLRTARAAIASVVPAARRDRGALPRNRRARPVIPSCPEIDCVRHLLPPGIIGYAQLRAAQVGVGADRVLIAQGLLDEETYVREFARSINAPFEPLVDRPREACSLTENRLARAGRTGLLPLVIQDDLHFVVALRELTARRLIEILGSRSTCAGRIRLTTGERMARFVARHAQQTIGYQAAERLRTERPELSAGTGRRTSVLVTSVVAAFAPFALLASGNVGFAFDLALGAIFLAWTVLRLFAVFSLQSTRRSRKLVADRQLPTYTIVIALYREAAAVRGLVAALRRLNYPAEKLDIKLVVEPDDRATRAALAAMRLTAPFEIVVAPEVGPRTKPKALNAALPFVRGDFVAIYDAEDRPEPEQLRLAFEAFLAGDRRLACVQARLTIDNTSDSWLARLFTAEFAGLFDVFLPGLAKWRLPLPLGGSSNHFRTDVLVKAGAWDPYNVTEDADLGMRLARLGYRTAVIQSTTYEEAPAHFRPWIKQRTRWFKGWIQTWLVHMRSPRRLRRNLGWTGFSVFQLLVGGTVLAALVHSLFVLELLCNLAVTIWSRETPAPATVSLHAGFLMAGYLVSITLGVVGLAQRRLLNCAWALILIPVYWILLSLAAWRALIQLVTDPYRWEKTEHGLARTSRLAQRSPQPAKGSGAGRLRPRPDVASRQRERQNGRPCP